jgi:hypothetical protein
LIIARGRREPWTAILFHIVSFIGLRSGPARVDVIRGMFAPRYGEAFALRIGVIMVTLISADIAYMFGQTSRSVVGDRHSVDAT